MQMKAGERVQVQKKGGSVSVRLTEAEEEKLERIAERTFRKKTDVVRMALNQFFEAIEERGEL